MVPNPPFNEESRINEESRKTSDNSGNTSNSTIQPKKSENNPIEIDLNEWWKNPLQRTDEDFHAHLLAAVKSHSVPSFNGLIAVFSCLLVNKSQNKEKIDLMINKINEDNFSFFNILLRKRNFLLAKQLVEYGLEKGKYETPILTTKEVEDLCAGQRTEELFFLVKDLHCSLFTTPTYDVRSAIYLLECNKFPREISDKLLKVTLEQIKNWGDREMDNFIYSAMSCARFDGLITVLKSDKANHSTLKHLIDSIQTMTAADELNNAILNGNNELAEFLVNKFLSTMRLHELLDASIGSPNTSHKTIQYLIDKGVNIFSLIKPGQHFDSFVANNNTIEADKIKTILHNSYKEKIKAWNEQEILTYLEDLNLFSSIEPLHLLMAEERSKNIIKKIWSNEEVDSTDVLYEVIKRGEVGIAKELISLFGKKRREKDNKFLIDVAIVFAINTEQIEVLKNLWPDILSKSIYDRQQSLLDLSLEKRADEMTFELCSEYKNNFDYTGLTPLIYLVIANRFDLIKRLFLERKEVFDPNGMDAYGHTPLIVAMNDVTTLDNLLKLTTIKTLLNDPVAADPNYPDKENNLPLFVAIRSKNASLVKLLLENKKTDVLKKEYHLTSALKEAKSTGIAEIIKLVNDSTLNALIQKLKSYLEIKDSVKAKELLKDYYEVVKILPSNEELKLPNEVYTFMQTAYGEFQKQEKKTFDLKDELYKIFGEELDIPVDKIAPGKLTIINGKIYNTVKALLNNNETFVFVVKELELSNPNIHSLLRQNLFSAAFDKIKDDWRNNLVRDTSVIGKFLKQHNLYDEKDKKFLEHVINSATSLFTITLYLELIFGKQWSKPFYKYLKKKPDKEKVEIYKKLIELGLNYETTDKENNSFLSEVILYDDKEMLKMFFYDMDTQKRDAFFSKEHRPCPLALAIENENTELVKWFLDNGADPIHGFIPQQKLLEMRPYITPEIKELLEFHIKKISTAKPQGAIITDKHQIKAKKAAHMLGLDRIILTTNLPNKTIVINPQSTSNTQGVYWTADSLKKYATKTKDQEISKVADSYNLTRGIFENKKSTSDLIDAYLKGETIILPSVWYGHGTCVVLKGRFLSFTNRGEGGDQKHGTKIYEINPSMGEKEITQFIHKILVDSSLAFRKGLLSADESRKYIENSINEIIVDPNLPFEELEQKGQQHGTCSVANRKAAVAAVLYLERLYKEIEPKIGKPTNINNPEDLNQVVDLVKIKKQCKEGSKKKYKEYTNTMRDDEIEEIIQDMKQNKHDSSFYYDILTAFVLEHQDFDKKAGKQGLRLLKILELLPEDYQARIKYEMGDKFEAFKKSKVAFEDKIKAVEEELPPPPPEENVEIDSKETPAPLSGPHEESVKEESVKIDAGVPTPLPPAPMILHAFSGNKAADAKDLDEKTKRESDQPNKNNATKHKK